MKRYLRHAMEKLMNEIELYLEAMDLAREPLNLEEKLRPYSAK